MSDIRFDYDKQSYYEPNGNKVEVDYPNFPCTQCSSPAKLVSTSPYYEYYSCTNEDCNQGFEVK